MQVSEVKDYLNKEVYYKLSHVSSPSKYILNAYIFRVHPKDRTKRLKEVELLDLNENSVLIANIEDVATEISYK